MNQLVSIITPVYNSQKYLSKCIESVISQSYTNWELILVNDGSTDDSFMLCEKYKIQDKRIVLISQENLGPSSARNRGLKKALGKYIAFLDSDDYLDNEYLSKHILNITNYNACLSCSGFIEVSENNPLGIKVHDFKPDLHNRNIDLSIFLDNLFESLTGVLWGKLYVNDIIKKNDIKLKSDVRLSEDLLFVAEYALHCSNIILIKDSLYNYNRLNTSSLSYRLNFKNFNDLVLVNSYLKELKIKEQISAFDSKLNKFNSNIIFNIIGGIVLKSNSFRNIKNELEEGSNYTVQYITSLDGIKKRKKIILKSLINKKYKLTYLFFKLYFFLIKLKK